MRSAAGLNLVSVVMPLFECSYSSSNKIHIYEKEKDPKNKRILGIRIPNTAFESFQNA
jgi:hypothetical protein